MEKNKTKNWRKPIYKIIKIISKELSYTLSQVTSNMWMERRN